MANKKHVIKGYYDELSSSYDELYGYEQINKYSLASNHICRLSESILDIGCGTLLIEEYVLSTCFLENTPFFVGIDFSSGMLSKAKEKMLRNSKLGLMVDLVLADAAHLPFRNNAFKHALSFTVIIDNGIYWNNIYSEVRRTTRVSFLYSIMKGNNKDDKTVSCPVRLASFREREEICLEKF